MYIKVKFNVIWFIGLLWIIFIAKLFDTGFWQVAKSSQNSEEIQAGIFIVSGIIIFAWIKIIIHLVMRKIAKIRIKDKNFSNAFLIKRDENSTTKFVKIAFYLLIIPYIIGIGLNFGNVYIVLGCCMQIILNVIYVYWIGSCEFVSGKLN